MTVFCAAVDWGTSSFRLWLLDAAGQVLAQRRSAEGLSHCIPDRFAEVLDSHLSALDAPRDLPVVICGMAGARQGWVEAPYITIPTPLDQISSAAIRLPDAGRDICILPGLAQRDATAADVMRGEETQLLGAFGKSTGNLTACLPGTHSKWVKLENGEVCRFMTFLTGELFAAIRHHTILAHAETGSAYEHDEQAFAQAVGMALARPAALTSALFSVRGRELLGYAKPQSAASVISGLLIGVEIAAVIEAGWTAGQVSLVATGPLGARYNEALTIAGISAGTVDAEAAVIDGLFDAALQRHSPRKRSTT